MRKVTWFRGALLSALFVSTAVLVAAPTMAQFPGGGEGLGSECPPGMERDLSTGECTLPPPPGNGNGGSGNGGGTGWPGPDNDCDGTEPMPTNYECRDGRVVFVPPCDAEDQAVTLLSRAVDAACEEEQAIKDPKTCLTALDAYHDAQAELRACLNGLLYARVTTEGRNHCETRRA